MSIFGDCCGCGDGGGGCGGGCGGVLVVLETKAYLIDPTAVYTYQSLAFPEISTKPALDQPKTKNRIQTWLWFVHVANIIVKQNYYSPSETMIIFFSTQTTYYMTLHTERV